LNVWQGGAQSPSKKKKQQQGKFGRSDRSAVGRWFWEIDRVLLLLAAVLISIGLIAVAAASPAAGQRYSGGAVSYAPLHFFYRQLVWIMVSVPVMIGVSMLPKSMARRLCLGGAAFFTVLLVFVPIIGNEVNGARRVGSSSPGVRMETDAT
jgi:cell division protein FtsW